MKVILFGATGMIGQGVMRECLIDADVTNVLSAVRGATGRSDPKLREMVLPDMGDLSGVEAELSGYDACLFCLGISSAGLSEAQYARVTHDLTLAVAGTLARLNPGMIFVYVSAFGSDSTESGRTMWARVRGRTENDLFRLPFARVHSIRPAAIRPLHGIRTRTAYLDVLYRLLSPLLPLVQAVLPGYVTSTEELARAMLTLAKRGGPKIVESREIAALAR